VEQINNYMEEHIKREKSAIENLKPRAAFKTGLLSGLGVMFAIGFFILLGIMLNGKSGDSNDNVVLEGTDNNPSVARAPQPTDNGEINIKPVDKKNDWIKGDKNAKISIIEFSDTECPFCKRFHATMNQVLAEYDGQVNWVYRHFPLTSLHAKAQREAEATECAGDQKGNDGFWAFTDRLFEITPSNDGLSESQLTEIADYAGLNVGKFQECLDSGKFASKVQGQARDAQAAGGRGTPYSVILAGDQKIPIPGALPFDSVKSTLDSLIK
jgi:protein-disulfide isomerase